MGPDVNELYEDESAGDEVSKCDEGDGEGVQHGRRQALDEGSVRMGFDVVHNEDISPPLRVLEVGAINPQLSRCPWLDVRAIDIRSQHPLIEEVDLFDLPPRQEYDVVVSSMVRGLTAMINAPTIYDPSDIHVYRFRR
jgi:hypothetical protein